jgi:hypothetical protein
VEKAKRLGGYEDLEDDTQRGRCSTAQNPGTVAKLSAMVGRDH